MSSGRRAHVGLADSFCQGTGFSRCWRLFALVLLTALLAGSGIRAEFAPAPVAAIPAGDGELPSGSGLLAEKAERGEEKLEAEKVAGDRKDSGAESLNLALSGGPFRWDTTVLAASSAPWGRFAVEAWTALGRSFLPEQRGPPVV